MLTNEENEYFTRVGPGTPAGELFRRYWLPCAVAAELTDEQPTQFVRLLGEDLVLFRDRGGRAGLLGDHCPHRGASLLYGRVEERGIACAYHGWLYDVEGNCLETPAEPADSHLHLTIKHRAYPVRKFVGLYWAYLGPPPAPIIPRYDIWARTDGARQVLVQPRLDCNWLQPMENSADSAHAQILHQNFLGSRGHTGPTSTTRGLIDLIAVHDYAEGPLGLIKHRAWTDGRVEDHPLIFPNILRQGSTTQIRTPIDDTHTRIFYVRFDPDHEGNVVDQDDPEVEYVAPYKEPPDALHPVTRFQFRDIQAQDHMVWETQGPISDRAHERLATSDRGVVMYREMLKREIGRVQRGLDPLGVVRDPDHSIIDTGLEGTMAYLAMPGRI